MDRTRTKSCKQNIACNVVFSEGRASHTSFIAVVDRVTSQAQGYLHYGNKWADRSQKGGPLWLPQEVGEDFHVYSIEKTPSQIDFFLNGHLYQSYASDDVEPRFTWPFENTFHFILNLAVGGHWPVRLLLVSILRLNAHLNNL